MLNFRKTMDLKRLFERMVSMESVIASVFKDNAELESFGFSCRSEYDDNNYSDFIELTKVNEHRVDYEGRYEDEDHYEGPEGDEEEEKSNLPRLNQSVIHALMDVVSTIGNYYGHDEHVIRRSEYASTKNRTQNSKEEQRYLNSYISKEPIEDEWFLKADPKWAAYYAQDHGKFSKEVETALFCADGRMEYAFMYSQALKKPLPKNIENYFTTKNLVDPNEKDDVWFKEYLKFKNHLNKTKVK